MKTAFYTSFFLVFLGIYITLIYKVAQNLNVDLVTIETYSGKVVEVGERGDASHLTFYFQIEGLSQKMGVYRMNKDYQSLTDQLKTGDIVKVYYIVKNTGEINTDVVQIEKNGIIVLEKEEYEKKQAILVWMAAIAGLFTLGLLVSYLKGQLKKNT